ncbi:MAG: DUF2996 domain-containing protein [Prochloraceae cyanobacterium]|nr:DUF2996 domain-containing protein [Prochloraceae cyanobacterium]
MAEETKPSEAKKAKPPAIEKKPFTEFMEEHFLPGLKDAFPGVGVEDMKLSFVKEKLPIANISNEECWQVKGNWDGGKRQFNLYFPDESITGQKGFSYSTNGSQPSTLESFMIDERRITLDLMVMYTIQRLNSQKWLTRN